eukprot:TRINITY_DN4376_c0_g1_i8.p1 TRINITY_DN4376_c0_g1~~TRINITY_DN4376_c0_g1_i8.p1  ORF type:complete len:486 (+),score=120.23 TRINITY_DN4376_c0_g1_i8:71-1528(+)
MLLYVKLESTGEVCPVEVDGHEKVAEVKAQAAAELGVDCGLVDVWVGGEKVEDEAVKVSMLAVCEGDEVELVEGKGVAARVVLEDLGVEPTAAELLRAVEDQNETVVAALINSGLVANPAVNTLIAACRTGDLRIAQMVLNYLPHQATTRAHGTYPTHAAVEANSVDIVRMLVDYTPEAARLADEDRITPLSVAANHGFHDICRFLLSKQVRVDQPDRFGKTPVVYGCEGGGEGHAKCVLDILATGEVDLERQNYMNVFRTVLMVAASMGMTRVCEEMIRLGAKVCAKDGNWKTALHYAAEMGHPEACRVLLDSGADVDALDAARVTPLHLAFQNNHPEVASVLITEYNASTNLRLPTTNMTPLHCAAFLNCHSVLSSLPLTQPLTHALDATHSTPLLLSIRHNHPSVTNILLAAPNPPIHIPDASGMTCLHHAARRNQLSLVKELLAKGADPTARDGNKKTPLYYAMQGGHREIEAIIMKLRKV